VAIRPILTQKNPRLRMKSIKVKRVDKSMQALIDDMIETMRSAEGVGLAAPQIGVLLRVIVCEYFDEDADEMLQTVLINPEFLSKEGEWMAEEGCLSIPGYVGTVPRAIKVSVKGKDRNGKDIRIKTDGQLAHILQHEMDHLDGILYIDYLDSLDELREVEPNRRRRRRRRGEGEEEAEADDAEAEVDGDEDDDEERDETRSAVNAAGEVDPADAAIESDPVAEGAQPAPEPGEGGSAPPARRSEGPSSSSRGRYRPKPCCWFGTPGSCE